MKKFHYWNNLPAAGCLPSCFYFRDTLETSLQIISCLFQEVIRSWYANDERLTSVLESLANAAENSAKLFAKSTICSCSFLLC